MVWFVICSVCMKYNIFELLTILFFIFFGHEWFLSVVKAQSHMVLECRLCGGN